MKGKFPGPKPTALVVSLLLILTITVGGTLAILVAATDPVVNLFQPSSVSCALVEQNDGYVITNTGTTEAYIRVAVVANWGKNGAVYGLAPITAGDYTVAGTGWVLRNGYYYYQAAVAPGASSAPLTVRQLTAAPEGCAFSVELLAEAIQSKPASAAAEAWGFTPSN